MSAEDRDREFVLLAHLIRTQGRHGELIADILTDFPERFAERRNVWLLPPAAKGAPREAELERHWLHKRRVVLKFVGVDSISDATLLSGWQVAIPREQRAWLSDDAVYVADLIGCHLIDETGGAVDLGPVLDVERGAGNAPDMLVLKSGEDELLIPFAKAYLVSLDLDARVLRMRLPAGLTTINAPITEEERAAQQQASEDDGADDAL
ncbi:MAG: rRNA processing protein RimM [Acidobacteriaceae bacterium]|jgi:16S rRNA processing protein RimM|nr:rRNA processing protein RimM [Acidobacteriaceae bacterium]